MTAKNIDGPEVYRAINAVQKALSKEGITKDRTNTSGASFRYRGIDDVYNALSGLLAEHQLCILPRGLNRELTERLSQANKALFYVTVTMEYDFVSAVDGSKHTVGPFYGEAMDSGDKATNKAMSIAYKMMAFEAFAIPTEADNDADAHTHQVQPSPALAVQADRNRIAAVEAVVQKVFIETAPVVAKDGWIPLMFSTSRISDIAEASKFALFVKEQLPKIENKDRLTAFWKTHTTHIGDLKSQFKPLHKEVSDAFAAKGEELKSAGEAK